MGARYPNFAAEAILTVAGALQDIHVTNRPDNTKSAGPFHRQQCLITLRRPCPSYGYCNLSPKPMERDFLAVSSVIIQNSKPMTQL